MNKRINDYQQALYAWYAPKPASEKKIIIILVALITLTFLVYGVWKPSYLLRMNAQKNYQNAQGLLWQLQGLPVMKANASAETSLLSLLNTSATELNLVLARVEPEGDESVRVGLDKADFNQFAKWLIQLEQQKVRVADLQVERSSTNDGVSIRAKFMK